MVEQGVERRALMGLIAGAAVLPGPALADQDPPNATEPLKYLDAARRLSVRALVNGQGPFDFLVDTGANSSVITTELALALDLPRVGVSQLHSIAGAQAVEMTRIDSLTVGRRSRHGMRVSVLPRAQLRMDGILGLDWLGQASLLLDFKRRRMTVGEGLPVPNDRTAVVKSRLLRSGLTLIDAYMPVQRLIAFVDSGSTRTVANLALLEAGRDGAVVSLLGRTELRSVTGQVMSGQEAILSRLTLSKMILRNVPLIIGPIHTFDYWGFNEQPAIVIGTDILQQFEMVAMDFRRNEVRFHVAG